MRQVHGFLLHVVEQTPRCRHQNVDVAMQLLDLRVDVDAAKHHHGLQRQIFTVFAHALLHLGGEFARRGEYQRTDICLARDRFFGHQALQQRQCEAGRLAGAGLCAAHQVAALQNNGNGLRLNRRGFGVTALGNGADEFGGQAEGCK